MLVCPGAQEPLPAGADIRAGRHRPPGVCALPKLSCGLGAWRHRWAYTSPGSPQWPWCANTWAASPDAATAQRAGRGCGGTLARRGALGWGGRFGDVAAKAGANINKSFSQISLAGNTVFLSGEQVGPYQIGVDGVQSIYLLDRSGNGVPVALDPILRDHFSAAGANRSNLL